MSKYLLVGAVILALVLWTGRRSRWVRTEGAKLLSASLSMALFAAAAFWGARGAWGKVLVLLTLGAGLALGTRSGARPSRRATVKAEPLGLKEARDLLGVEETASKAEVRAAYNRLMRMAHPDHGGTAGLAAQLNAARDRLLKGP